MKQKWILLCLPLLLGCSNLQTISRDAALLMINAINEKYTSLTAVELNIEVTFKHKDNDDYLEQYAFDLKNERLYIYQKDLNSSRQYWRYFANDILWELNREVEDNQEKKSRYQIKEQPAIKGLDYFRQIFYSFILKDLTVVNDAFKVTDYTKATYQSNGVNLLLVKQEKDNHIFIGEFDNNNIKKINLDTSEHLYDYVSFISEVNPNDFPEVEKYGTN